MPEGPEVRLSADLIRPLLVNKQVISAFTTPNGRYNKQYPENYEKFVNVFPMEIIKIEEIKTKGKFMYWKFSNNWYMFNTFGMSGQWSPQAGKHPCLGFHLGENLNEHKETIIFNDPRHFGTIKFTNNSQDLINKLNALGWDAFSMPLDLSWMYQQFKRINKPIAEVMMDQTIFAGCGNYLRAEILYHVKMSPWKISSSLTENEVKALCEATIEVMNESYQHQGATIKTYKTSFGEEGKYSSCFRVYGKKQDPNGYRVITQQTKDKRTIHWCPEVQQQ